MCIILEVGNSDVDVDLTSVRPAEDSFMPVLNDRVDETSPPVDGSVSASEESQSESSDSSYLNTDLDRDDNIDDGEIDTAEFMHLNEQQVNQELGEVSSGMAMVILKLHSQLEIVCF